MRRGLGCLLLLFIFGCSDSQVPSKEYVDKLSKSVNVNNINIANSKPDIEENDDMSAARTSQEQLTTSESKFEEGDWLKVWHGGDEDDEIAYVDPEFTRDPSGNYEVNVRIEHLNWCDEPECAEEEGLGEVAWVSEGRWSVNCEKGIVDRREGLGPRSIDPDLPYFSNYHVYAFVCKNSNKKIRKD